MENLILYEVQNYKHRVGRPNDGGYCIIDLPGSYDLFISGGISNDISFEKALLDLYSNLNCIAFDGTINSSPDYHDRLTYVKKNLGNTNNDNLTNLDEYINKYNNVFMKIDIEGHEFRLIPSLIQNNHMQRIKQLVIEIHTPGDIHLYPDYFNGLSDITNDKMFDMFNKINNTHTLVHLHANNGCNIQEINNIKLPHVFELTYIRNDFVTNKKRNEKTLPTNIDMKNIPWKPDYILEGFPYTI
jgi:hypothetical protein